MSSKVGNVRKVVLNILQVPFDVRLKQLQNLVKSSLHDRHPRAILSSLAAQGVSATCDTVRGEAAVYDNIVQQLNALPRVYASQHAHLSVDQSVLRLAPPADIKACGHHWGWELSLPCILLDSTGTESC